MLFPPRRPRPRRMLLRANKLFDQGEFAEAAPIFERLAEGAVKRGLLNRGGDLFLQSARCHLEAGNVTLAVERGKQALHLFGRAGLIGKIEVVIERVEKRLSIVVFIARPEVVGVIVAGEVHALRFRRGSGGERDSE